MTSFANKTHAIFHWRIDCVHDALMAVQRFEIDVDPTFEIHTSYHNNFFLLRTRVLVNGGKTEICSMKEGKYEGPVLNFCRSGSTISTKLSLISKTFSPILVQYGVYHVDTFYYEQSPLFHVVFSSESCLKNFILAIDEVKSALEPKLQSLFLNGVAVEAELAQQLTIEVQPSLFLVSPSLQRTKGAEISLVTKENFSTFVTQWKDSKLFDFRALYQEDAESPKLISQPTSQKDVLPGKAVAFSVQATGTKPLRYKWQWRSAGERDRSEVWQNLCCGGSLQGVDAPTLTHTNVQSYNEGLYRCVVTNCTNEIISDHAKLTVAKKAELVDLFRELEGVTEWLCLGMCLGVRWPRLMDIKSDYQLTTKDRREQVLIEWQKQVTPLTWSAVVKALVGIRREGLAAHLASKYGVPLPDRVDNEPLETLQVEAAGSKLAIDIQHHSDNLQHLGQKLTEVEKLLKSSRDSQLSLNENADYIRSKLSKLSENYESIAKERESTGTKLQCNERDCLLLSELQMIHMEDKGQPLQEMIDDKKREIKKLHEDLQQKEHDLELVQQEAKLLQERLSKVQAELSAKHKEVKQLQQKNKELISAFNLEREQMQTTITLLISDREDMMQQLTTTKVESELKSQEIEACNFAISHFSKEIESLSTSLQEKKAIMEQLQQAASSPIDLSVVITLITQIASLQQKLQEMEYQKQQAELERDAAVQDVEAREKFELQLHAQLDEPPKVTHHPESTIKACPGTTITFSVQATGTDPLHYQWEWWSADQQNGSKEWQLCHVKCDDATLSISNVQKSNNGNYRCVVRNYAGTQTSNPAQLSVVDPPRITIHPQDLKDVVPGKPVMFCTEVDGTEPLSYQWEWNPPGEANEWQPCCGEGFAGADLSRVTIPSVQKSNEGSYRCVIWNCAGSQKSKPAQLSVGNPPRIISHPEDLKNIVAGKHVMFTVQATGKKPLSYQWQWKHAESEKWQLCDAQGSNSATLTIASVQKSNEGSYHCVISNYTGSQTSNPAQLSVVEPPRIISQPHEFTNAVRGKPAKFTIQAIGTEPLRYQWHWKPAKKWGWSAKWHPWCAEWSDGAMCKLTIPNVQKSNEGTYCCVVSNYAGNQTSHLAKLETCPLLQLPLRLKWRRCRGTDYAMSGYPHLVILQRNIYVGGGEAGNDSDECTVLQYNMESDKWCRLPRYRCWRFAMTVIDNHLTLVGGWDTFTRKVTNLLAVFDPTSEDWTYPYPPMPTPRHSPAVSTYDIWLLVAGGYGGGNLYIATVELLNTSTNQWLSASPLPTPCGYITSTIDQDNWYLITNTKQVFCASFPDLVSQTVSNSNASKSPALWCRLPDTPLGYSAATTLRGSLLAVGGLCDDGTSSTDIHLYQSESDKWTKVGDLPTACYYCSCISLPSGELLVVGGEKSSARYISRVNVATILEHR